jgi:hypothetical protein
MAAALNDHTGQQPLAQPNPRAAAWPRLLLQRLRHRVFEQFVDGQRQRDASDVASIEREERLHHAGSISPTRRPTESRVDSAELQ